MSLREDIRNIAIIAHVDHGKTTLVDALLKQSGIFRENQEVQDRVMDSNDLERERGITILSKNTAIHYKNAKINIIDTPGHADFGGEVERVLKMVNGVILVVDSFEGPMPQTRFVLKKALELNLPVLVCINKVDRPEGRAEEVVDEVLELLLELDESERYLDSHFIFASAIGGWATDDLSVKKDNMEDMYEAILKYMPAPEGDFDAPPKMLISTIDYNEYIGRIGVGKVESGIIKVNQEMLLMNHLDENKKVKVKIGKLYEYDGLKRVEVPEAKMGSIVAISGIEDLQIGDTLTDPSNPNTIEFVNISEPTIAMTFSVNDSPFAGQEGKFVTSRQIKDRLQKELNTNISLRVEETDSADAFKVSGRGELHLSILMETMRREGYEFQVSKPEVLFKTDINGKKLEPMEIAVIDVPEEFMGSVMEKMGLRKGEMKNMIQSKGGYVRLEFSIPTRGLIGYRSEFLTDTKGNGIINTLFDKYDEYKGAIETRSRGSLVAFESGVAVTYGLYNAQERGILFVEPGEKVYSGQVVGLNARPEDIDVNVCKRKQATNMRASGSDDALRLSPAKKMSLEETLEFIDDDELIELTPISMRIRKRILDKAQRAKARSKN
ncbi:GTP-binding protein TypA/BipA [Peptoanaerobacter stomatis]|uniref:Large ribosomal subunit assembly factor BipA n=1 Tax=Peptoanaerobacter stomatis TaxID=796937 RepID=G9XFR7_9FIRM|nr:translational GTPase TypA [Peptoanaerobacter stomatis]EHL15810.1 GTP-binding protein TypA/BipA [Peptoanaerobacter stomatis]EHL15984.1 GTP-binding protein TypA/BipA [Peptoanaerobacter stomatis]